MARTTFSGPVKSDNGFEGAITATSTITTTLSATSAAIGTLSINGSLVIGSGFKATSGIVSAQIGFIPVLINGSTKYIGLYSSVTL
jgi:hypothetical protein